MSHHFYVTCEWPVSRVGGEQQWRCRREGQPSRRYITLAANIYANWRYVRGWHLCQTWHITFTFVCLFATSHIKRWSGRWWLFFFFKLPNAVQVTPLGIVEDIWRHFQMFFVASTFFFFPLNLTRAEPQRCDETKTEHLSYMNIKLKQEEAFCSILSVVVRLSWRDFFFGGGVSSSSIK